LAAPPHYDATLAVYCYAFPIDKLVQAFKYGHRLALGAWFGSRLAELARGFHADLIVPMPLHRLRLRERGFNQALELARAVSRCSRIPIDARTCTRIRQTATQADLPWRERAGNVRGAFQFRGIRPRFMERLKMAGVNLPPEIFDPNRVVEA